MIFRQNEAVFGLENQYMCPSDFQKWDKIFLASIGFSDGGNWLVIVNARFPKKDKNLFLFYREIREKNTQHFIPTLNRWRSSYK